MAAPNDTVFVRYPFPHIRLMGLHRNERYYPDSALIISLIGWYLILLGIFYARGLVLLMLLCKVTYALG